MAAATALLAVGGSSAHLLHSGARPPAGVLAVLMLAVTLWAIWRSKVTQLNLLPRMMILVYALPFSTLIGYAFDPDYIWVFTPLGAALGRRPELNSVILLTGLAGICGLAAGLHFVAAFARRCASGRQIPQAERTLGRPMFAMFVLLAVFLSQISASPESIFDSAYSTRTIASTATNINFPAAFLISYVCFVILWLDVERENDRVARWWKMAGLGIALTYVVVVLQVLRGDRESSGLVAALAVLYLTAPLRRGLPPTRSEVMKRVRRLVLPLVALVLLFISLGYAREAVPAAALRLTPAQAIKLGWHYNTWTGVLWTNLGAAWEYQEGVMKYKWGSTYRDYLLSLPPGAIARLYGYERPQESWRGIGYEGPLGVSSGGLHVVIPAFKNFGGAGVLLILTVYGVALGMLERAAASYRFIPRLMWGSMFCASFLWFWYGEMSVIRAVMAALIFVVVYRFGTLPHAVFQRPSPVRSS